VTAPPIGLALPAALALAVCSLAAAASGPPTLRELANDLLGTRTVPGLVYRLLPSSRDPRTAPSPAKCVAVWNASLPLMTRRYVISYTARRADVTLEEDVGQKIGGATSTQYGCASGVAIGPRSLLVAFAAPRDISYPWRGQLDIYRDAATLTRLLPRFNATVSETAH
jgi:hypothetical protein